MVLVVPPIYNSLSLALTRRDPKVLLHFYGILAIAQYFLRVIVLNANGLLSVHLL